MKVRYGLIGFGGIAENRVAKEGYACDTSRFASLKKAQLVGAFDLNPARKEAAEALGLKWYDSIDAILADKEIDAVYVLTPNYAHYSVTMDALKAGKHVYSAVPCGITVEEITEIESLVRKSLKDSAFNKISR